MTPADTTESKPPLSDSISVASATAPGSHSEAEPPHRTLPPPEWLAREGPRSAASLVLEYHELDTAIPRRPGARAELLALQARLRTASARADEAEERHAAAGLARGLAARGTELETATRLARRALLLGDDVMLREELAGWFANLGEPALAAATLKQLLSSRSGAEAATLLIRIAVLFARAGEAFLAREVLADALRENPTDALPAELLGTLGAWAGGAVPIDDSAQAYLDASDRREALGERAPAFENLIRAYELSPGYGPAIDRLCAALMARGRVGAADEVRREHARASGVGARAVHIRRVRDAMRDGDLARALGAAFDARLDAELDLSSVLSVVEAADPPGIESSVGFDKLLDRLGLYELLAARVELACDMLVGRERARARFALGRIYSTQLGRPERAIDSWIDALAMDPGAPEPRQALEFVAEKTGDMMPLVEALIRIAENESQNGAPERLECLRELVAIADRRLADPGLALWALQRIPVERRDEALVAATPRLELRAQQQNQALSAALHELESASGSERIEALSRAAFILHGRPDQADLYAHVLLELSELTPEERSFELAAERLLLRRGQLDELGKLLERQRARVASPVEKVRLSLALAMVHRRLGEPDAALRELEPLIDEGAANAAAWSMALLIAAERGNESVRARALLRLAAPFAPALRAVLSSVAAESLLRAGELDKAKAAAEQACQADPSLARPVAVRSQVGLVFADRWGAEALERAMGVIVPRAALCAELANIYDRLGDPMLALAWTQRLIAIRPGDIEAVRIRLDRALRIGDATRVADTLGWVLSQPQPLFELSDAIANGLRQLSKRDPSRAGALARRALDVLGPRELELRSAIMAVAEASGERGLAIAVLERWLAAGTPGHERSTVLLELARRRRVAGDSDGSARVLLRSIRDGAQASAILSELDVAPATRTSDGEVALLEARAEALSALSEADQAGTAMAWRAVGAAYWDLALDPYTAVKAWERAALLDPERGIERFASDIAAFGGPDEAIKRLKDLAKRREQPREAARCLAAAATVALAAGRLELAFQIGSDSLDLDPSRADVLAIAERSARDEDLPELEHMYQRLADAALGRYGERAVHYRAARQLERRLAIERALHHAVKAFEAVPTEGVAFVTMARIAERANQTAEAMRAIERVALGSKSLETRAAWLRRAATFATDNEEGRRQRVEILLRALTVQPEAEMVRALSSAVGELLVIAKDEYDIWELRFQRSISSLLKKLEGPEGARIALEAAIAALTRFKATQLAFDALECAVGVDGDIDEFSLLFPHDVALARNEVCARAFCARVRELSGQKFASVGTALLDLASRIAEALGDLAVAAELLVLAAKRAPDNVELLERAQQAARAAGDRELLEAVGGVVPPRQQVEHLFAIAQTARQSGDIGHALEALERARSIEGVDNVLRAQAFERLCGMLRDTGRRDRLEEVLSEELATGEFEPEGRSRVAAELSALVAARGDPRRGLEIIMQVVGEDPDNQSLLADLATLARQAGDTTHQAAALDRLVDLAEEETQKRSYLHELCALLESVGDQTAAVARFRELLELEPNDVNALFALERDAERRGDYETLIMLFGRHAALANSREELQSIRLRRATVLDQRLGRPDDARAELEALTTAIGDNLDVLHSLADLNERLGVPLRAAALWLRASAIAPDSKRAAELSSRACEAYLSGGDVESARRVLESAQAWARSQKLLELGVEIERRRENPLGLAEALDELASNADYTSERRAALLVEAARASLAGGARDAALRHAERGARLSPMEAEPQLVARWLEYLARGPGSPEDARITTVELRGIRSQLEPVQADLRAFLIAEALDIAVGAGAGARELARARADIGTGCLIALGLAERYSRSESAGEALELFDIALAGDLRDVRRRGRVALDALRVALEQRDADRAGAYLQIAQSEPETRDAAMEMVPGVQALRRPTRGTGGPYAATLPGADYIPQSARAPQNSRYEETANGRYSARPAGQHAEEHVDSAEQVAHGQTPFPEGSKAPSSLPVPTIPKARAASRSVPRSAISGRYSVAPQNEVVHTRAPLSVPPSAAGLANGAPARHSRIPSAIAPSAIVQPESRIPSVSSPTLPPRLRTPSQPTLDLALLRSSSSTLAAGDHDEKELYDELLHGSPEAGQKLIERLRDRPGHSQELVNVCRRVALLLPGSLEPVAELHKAILADRNVTYARAVEHVLRVLEPGSEPIEPPPLSEQSEEPDAVRGMLFRDCMGPAQEALALVWEGAEHIFRRDASTYGVTGLERIPSAAQNVLARVYGSAARSLGALRTPLFQRRSAGAVTVSLALLSPPALILSGDVRHETPELRFHIGAMLAAATPHCVLIFGSPESQVRAVLKGLTFAFGPPRPNDGNFGSVLNLAEVLWESIPARFQRRLRELCDRPETLDYDAALGIARIAVRRAGLFVAGDLNVALREVCNEDDLSSERLSAPGGLSELSQASASVRSLLALALSPEYAESRWQVGRAASRSGF